jgi:hypothetical protein
MAEITIDIKAKIRREFYDLYRRDQILIERSYLSLRECIGRGNFGCVYKGILKSTENEHEEVAVKILESCEFMFFR